MSGKVAPPAETSRPAPAPSGTGRDVRASRLYVLSRGPILSVVGRVLSVAALVALDIAGLALGIYLALVVRELVTGNGDVLWSLLWREGPAEWLKFAAPITVLVFAQAGLYRRRELRPGAGRILACLIVVALIVLAFGIGTGYDFSTSGLIPTSVILSAVTIGLLRAAYESAALEVMRAAGIRRRVVLVGAGESLVRLRASLESARSGPSYEFVGVVAPDAVPGFRLLGGQRRAPARPRPGSAGRGDPHGGRLRRAHRLPGRRAGAQAGHQGAARTRHDRAPRAARGVRAGPGRSAVRAAPARPDRLGLGGEARIRPRRERARHRVGLPLWLLIALAIKIGSRGPIFFVDRRIGVGEREFGMLKFRTMVADAAELQPKLENVNEAEGALFKIRDDPRVTRVGRFLRRFSLDEIPQVVNVVKGEMSLVGPRPLPLRDHRLLEDWHRARYRVLPGMTGLWQISGRSGLSFDDLVRLDFTYLENWSIWLDISIIAKTIPAVIARRGAY